MVNRYGGYALNFDTLLIKSILGLNSNFLTKCSEDSIEDLPYFLHHKHPLMDDVLSQLSKGFNMNVSQSIGRNLITKIVKQECNVSIYPYFRGLFPLLGSARQTEHFFCQVDQTQKF